MKNIVRSVVLFTAFAGAMALGPSFALDSVTSSQPPLLAGFKPPVPQCPDCCGGPLLPACLKPGRRTPPKKQAPGAVRSSRRSA